MALSFAVNYVAVVVATVAALIVGFIWFMPMVFGSRWLAYLGRPGEQLRPGPEFVLSIASAFVNAWTLAVLALNLKAASAMDGVVVGVLVWLGFFVTVTTANTVIAKRPWGLWAIDVGHALVAQVAMAVIVTVMR
jgi:uncharacterized protein DUF1761